MPTDYQRAIVTLEYDKITQLLADCAPTEGAADIAKRLYPDSNISRICASLRNTSDAKTLCMAKGLPSFGSIRDISSSLERADKGAVLNPRELLDIAAVLSAAERLLSYYNDDRRHDEPEDSLCQIFSRLTINRSLKNHITRAIISEDMIADDASPELADIRRRMRAANNRIKDTLQKYISGSSHSRALQDNIVTMRNGRYVLPVKSECKNEIKGLVHDTSASGATLFIEPLAVVEANNELKELESKEEHEIERILAGLSSECASYSTELLWDYRNITEIAFIFAKAELSVRMDACEPEITEKKRIVLKKARHPLIDRESVVPVNISLGEDYDTIVITGPNTGGKTVTLKTLGLFALMVQSGLHIPCGTESVMCIFDSVLADIGDEQSIEQSLSTFSAHMVNIVDITAKANDRSLVLFDELGAGTDPTEGAALAISVLEEIRGRGALCAATTHYSELKSYALETDRVINASCEFNVETLKPTYRLIIGTPGRSNAFAISLKLGLPETIIENAKKLISSENKRFEDVIDKLETSRHEMEKQRAEAEKYRREYEEFKIKAEGRIKERLDSAEAEIEKSRKKAQQILDSARASSDYIMSELDKLRREKEAAELAKGLDKARADIRRRLRETDDMVNPVRENTDDEYELPRALKKGDRVKIKGIGNEGVLADNPDKSGNVTVCTGMVSTRTNIKKLILVEEAVTVTNAEKKRIAARSYRAAVNKNFNPSLDLRGQYGEDAVFIIDKYIDEAKIANVSSVTIIHGKGTGALREAIWKFLKNDKRVKSYRAGAYGEGDSGVTVLEIK